MKTEKPHLIAFKTANRENFKKPHLTLTSKYMGSLLFELNQTIKAYYYNTIIIKIHLVAYTNSIRIE